MVEARLVFSITGSILKQVIVIGTMINQLYLCWLIIMERIIFQWYLPVVTKEYLAHTRFRTINSKFFTILYQNALVWVMIKLKKTGVYVIALKASVLESKFKPPAMEPIKCQSNTSKSAIKTVSLPTTQTIFNTPNNYCILWEAKKALRIIFTKTIFRTSSFISTE
jgi:hypothetical protein